jgi:hypothetical protein
LLVAIAHYYDITEARIVAGFLESHGIAAHINGLHLSSADVGMIVAMGGLALQVNEADVARARMLIHEAQTSGAEKCPDCGSPKIWKTPKAAMGFIQIVIALFGGGTQSARYTPRRRCLSCNHHWDAQDDPQELQS